MVSKIEIMERSQGDQWARTMWVDKRGYSHIMQSNQDGTRTETVVSPLGDSYTVSRGTFSNDWSLEALRVELELSEFGPSICLQLQN